MEVQDFIVSEHGQRPPMWATTGLLEQLQLQPLLCKRGLVRSPGWANRKISLSPCVGGMSCPILPCKSAVLGRCVGCFGVWG